jgi:DNA-binding SARP family transcriptional activator
MSGRTCGARTMSVRWPDTTNSSRAIPHPGARQPTDPPSKVRLIGQLAVIHAGRPLARAEIGSRKARSLLALLAVDRGTLTAERIADTLWSVEAPQRPAHNVATMVSRLRRVLGADSIVGDRAGYRLGSGVRVDLHDAAHLVDRVAALLTEGDPTSAMACVRRSLQVLDRGGVLDDEPHCAWAEPARVRHGTLHRRARRYFAESALRLGDIHTALTAAEEALAADRLDEGACRLLMYAYHVAGEPGQALAAFHQLRAALIDELGIYPSTPTHDLYVAILREEVPPLILAHHSSAATPAGESALAGSKAADVYG